MYQNLEVANKVLRGKLIVLNPFIKKFKTLWDHFLSLCIKKLGKRKATETQVSTRKEIRMEGNKTETGKSIT
jgi:hypothetical protein